MRTIVWACALASVGVLLLGGCSTAPKSAVGRENLDAEANAAVQVAKNTDPSFQKLMDTSAGYAVFPKVGKGAFVAGGAFGRGLLFEHGQPAGYCSLTQASVGLQAGGVEYTELIFFETPEALNKFKAGDFSFSADARAVAVRTGAAANASFTNGVVVFTMGQGGLMVSAAVAGQKFSYQPLGAVPPTASSPGTSIGRSGAGTVTVQPSSATTKTPE
ncbi:MAG: lipid-binding SYLF domain-containing protein [Planctomycetes bacterium]|nr:lipid-binding SYLF domain-containing protein [Planctomycetota bacterium]